MDLRESAASRSGAQISAAARRSHLKAIFELKLAVLHDFRLQRDFRLVPGPGWTIPPRPGFIQVRRTHLGFVVGNSGANATINLEIMLE